MVRLDACGVEQPIAARLEKVCWEVATFRVLSGNQQADHSRISDFRRRHRASLADLFLQMLSLDQNAGLVCLGHVALTAPRSRPMQACTKP